jgi:hypothetical protein
MHRIDSTRSSRAEGLERLHGQDALAAIPPEICELCFSDLVQPVDAKTNSSGTVRLTLRCPECHHIRVGESTWDEARELGRHFAKGRAALRTNYDRLAAENFRDELDCLVLAIHTDLIGPDDFTPFRFHG